MRTITASFLGLALLFATGCSGKGNAAVCAANVDCQNDERCVADACEPVICDPGCTTGFECQHGICACTEDAACPSGEVCDASGACVLDTTPPECTADTACSAGEICVEGGCVSSPVCGVDGDCPGARVCEAAVCVAACSTDGDCGSPAQAWLCEAGHCSPRCLGDNGCPVGNICEQGQAGGICRPAECVTLTDCAGSNVICDNADHGRCQGITPCTLEADCAFGETCGLPTPCPPGYDCSPGNTYCVARPSCVVDGDCATGQICDQDFCFDAQACTTGADCGANLDCVGGLCVPAVCRGPADCSGSQICVGGICSDPGTAAVDRVTILSPGGVLLPGETRRLIAVVYDGNGDAISGATITWSSSAQPSVSVDTTGLITGGNAPGLATITAASGGQQDTVTITLLDPLGGDFRVTVIDGDTGVAVTTATVQVEPNTGSPLESSVDGGGVARFTVVNAFPANVHIYDPDHDYVSLFQVTSGDLLVPLPPRSNTGLAGGLTGAMSYAKVTTTGDASVGLAGLSFGQSLADLDLTAVMGDTFVVTIPGMGQDIPLPGGMTTEVLFGGFPIPLKTTWYAQGEPGLRAVWAFAGKVGFDRFQGGGGAAGTLAGILPLFGLFEHGLVPRVLVADLATITDTADIDGDGNTSEIVPDWNAFPSRTLSPAQPQTLRLGVDPAPMPTLAGQPTDTVIFLIGSRTGRLGLTPLGLSATELANPGDTEAPAVTMRLTPVYGGLEAGDYQLLAMAATTQGGGGGAIAMPTQASARVVTTPNLPTNIALDPFLPFPEATAFAAGTRTVAAEDASSAASLHRERIAAAGRAWVVYGPASGGNWLLPAPPSGMDDPAASSMQVTISVIELSAGDYQSLTAATGTTLQSLDALTAAYARFIQ